MSTKVNWWWFGAAVAALLFGLGNELVVPDRALADSNEEVSAEGECAHNPAHCPDLAVSFQYVPDPIPPNIAQTVVIAVTNLASQRTARVHRGDVVLALTLSQQLQYGGFTAPPNVSCSPAGALVTTIQCQAARHTVLAPGQTLTFAFTFTNPVTNPRAAPFSPLSFTAVVDPAGHIRDRDRTNNAAVANTTLAPVLVQASGYFLACDKSLDQRRGTPIACEGFVQAPPIPGTWIVPPNGGLGMLDDEGLQLNTVVPSQGFTCTVGTTGFICGATAPSTLSPNQVLQVFSLHGTIVGVPELVGVGLRIDVNYCGLGIPFIGTRDCTGIGGSVGE